MEVQSLENIPNKVLDRIVELYSNDDNFRVIDERELLRCGEKKEYFLFAKDKNFGDLQWCFIWISNNIWQFSFGNPSCSHSPEWQNPLDILNEHLKNKIK